MACGPQGGWMGACVRAFIVIAALLVPVLPACRVECRSLAERAKGTNKNDPDAAKTETQDVVLLPPLTNDCGAASATGACELKQLRMLGVWWWCC
ncbi:hypothetical protein B0H65DRAFT_254596 [Neurospora tetraspora]|uniref:Uncharacterized protein n=1 Tax=Neurospora tetraspora TaxID=94610 RepID=A0AAE0MQM3_9PEZI|nr:hypothetical protein B0H65DRAFT_254596 [Neurospora tetraspora]